MRSSILVSLLLVIFGATFCSATLWDRGGGLIYDDVLDSTWLQNANYAATSGYVSNDGYMNWNEAMVWADQLEYRGYDDWRLPSAFNLDGSGPDSGPNVTGSEMGYMFYGNLDGVAGSSILDRTHPNMSLFINILGQNAEPSRGSYWSNTPVDLQQSDEAWNFAFDMGYQASSSILYSSCRAWAVRDGDVEIIPAPTAVLLATLGLSLAGWKLRRRKEL